MSDNENEKRDSAADILAEWRECIEAADPSVWNDARIAGLVNTTKAQQLAYLDRIGSAWKREREELDKRISDLEDYANLWTDRAFELRSKCDELYAKAKPVGNAAAMRDALELALGVLISWLNGTIDRTTNRETIKAIRAALAAPPRQCDVGTAEEQEERFKHFCASNYSDCDVDMECCRCPLESEKAGCEFAWAQTPYEAEEGGAK